VWVLREDLLHRHRRSALFLVVGGGLDLDLLDDTAELRSASDVDILNLLFATAAPSISLRFSEVQGNFPG
jgi:hypothetical protein